MLYLADREKNLFSIIIDLLYYPNLTSLIVNYGTAMSL